MAMLLQSVFGLFWNTLVGLGSFDGVLRCVFIAPSERTSERTSERAPRAILYATLAALTREATGPLLNGR